MLETVIFSIDKGFELRTQANFLGYIDTLRAMEKLKGIFGFCVGYHEGKLERKYLMTMVDYKDHVRYSRYNDKKKPILRVPADIRQPCSLVFFNGSSSVCLGCLKRVEPNEIHKYHSWTYVEQSNSYYVCEN